MLVQEITLTEALCGTSFTIKHLDDRILKVTSAPGEVITPDSWKCIQDEGMPEHGRPYEHGNMYIQFHVKFPETLSPQQVLATISSTPFLRQTWLRCRIGCSELQITLAG